VKIYCFDIDGTICTNTNGDYENAKPYSKRIEQINTLYENNNKIIFLTARGSTTKIDWEEVTKKQLNSWGVKYHELHLTKPHADFYIDDKSKDIFEWFN
tara:strand:- start:2193 stop:2489 length:297 start_codon:yes stop_codon:yes gene_type:complete